MPETEINEAILEGIHVDHWKPPGWTDSLGENDEWQPDIDPPHIQDYAAFKKHKHYGKYFRPYRYVPFPAWMYHQTLDAKIVKNVDEVTALGPAWRREPYPKHQAQANNMTGKSLPVKTETARLAELVAQGLASKSGPIDATAIAGIVAAVMAAMNGASSPVAAAPATVVDPAESDLTAGEGLRQFAETSTSEEDAAPNQAAIERQALIELAENEGVKIDRRWSNDRIRSELKLPEAAAS